VDSNEVAPQLPPLQTQKASSPQPLLTGHAFQPFHQLCCLPLDAFKDLHILLKSWGPELQTVLQVRPHDAEHRGMFPSVGRLAMLCLMHPRVQRFALCKELPGHAAGSH